MSNSYLRSLQFGCGLFLSVLFACSLRQSGIAEPTKEPTKEQTTPIGPHHPTLTEKAVLNLNFKPDPKSVSSEAGKELYAKFACAQCHQIDHVGGYVGPMLDGIGRLHSRDYISGHITDAQAEALKTDQFFELVPSSMPKFNPTPEQAKEITDYLMTLPKQ